MLFKHAVNQLEQQSQFVESLDRLPKSVRLQNELIDRMNLCYPLWLRKIHQIEQHNTLA